MRWIFLILLWGPLAALADQTAGSAWSLTRLMESLASVKVSKATFKEEKTLAILNEPLVTTGILHYRAPAYLKKQILQPAEESYEADEDWLTIENPSEGRRQFYLRGHPLIQSFVESVRATLAGNLATLERFYQLDLQGQPSDWTLRLHPSDKEMAKYVTAIIIHGQANRVRSIETLEADGDRSLMTIEPGQE